MVWLAVGGALLGLLYAEAVNRWRGLRLVLLCALLTGAYIVAVQLGSLTYMSANLRCGTACKQLVSAVRQELSRMELPENRLEPALLRFDSGLVPTHEQDQHVEKLVTVFLRELE
jgi:hypothetical protein